MVDEHDAPKAGKPWTAAERSAAVALYLRLLEAHLRGQQVQKRSLYRAFAAEFPARSADAIKRKLYNISACFIARRLPYLESLTPEFNYQHALIDDVIRAEREHVSLFAELADMRAVRERSDVEDTAQRLVVPPPSPTKHEAEFIKRWGEGLGAIDYVAREQDNAALGRAGEQWTVEFERRRLIEAGRRDLAKSVRHVAMLDGDGLGYDIRSFDPASGNERLIEVKTTRSGVRTSFYLTRNEVNLSRRESDRFSLYRVHSFGLRTRVYWLDGPLDQTCTLSADVYRALPAVQAD
jgi:hypothetical protein